MRTRPDEWTDRARSPRGKFKDKCKNEHPMTDDNTYVRPDGSVECNECRHDNVRRWRAKRRRRA